MTTNSLAMFPGQGSQKIGMGKDFFEQSAVAKELFERADSVLGFKLSSLCFEGPEDKLTLTEIVQPAILTVSTIAYRLHQAATGYIPSIAAGHSLGEYSALVAAEALNFEDAVVLVNKRGKYMQTAVPVGQGKMAAVLKKEVAEIEAALSDIPDVQIANINSPGQIVISGSASGVDKFKEKLPGAKIIELPVSAPFHCKLMLPAEEALAKDLATVKIQTPKFPVISNYYAKALQNPEEIRQALKLQVTGRVRWVESMQLAIDSGITTASEFGAGNVLSGLMKRINSNIVCSNY